MQYIQLSAINTINVEPMHKKTSVNLQFKVNLGKHQEFSVQTKIIW